MHNREGIRKCKWSGVGPGLRWQDFLEGFQRPGRGGWCSGSAPKIVACSVDLVCNAAASPDKSALPGTSSNVHRGNRLVDVDVARPITPEKEGVQQLPQPIRASGAASADSFAAKNRGHCRRSGEQLLAVACGAAFGVQTRFSRVVVVVVLETTTAPRQPNLQVLIVSGAVFSHSSTHLWDLN